MYYQQIIFLLAVVILSAVPSVFSRKCYTCNSMQNPACADGYQTGQMQYQDCANQQQFNQFPQTGAGGVLPGGGGFPGQQQQFGGVLDRCVKVLTVGAGMNGQPSIQRMCGSSMQAQGPMGGGGGSDSCFWNQGIQTCICDSNYCNGSSQLSKSKTSIALISGFVTVLASLLCRQAL